ncbi:MAG: long-chain fatty acid--CoA ligase [Gammaproteobacteria bacterium]|nr:long-chain fatty acid--CoA ligase [Gammaproteobacteria bacterium]MCP5137889.1 long-chain fatty acid--CoA ligase [Gammaproteobacteria bacterium]
MPVLISDAANPPLSDSLPAILRARCRRGPEQAVIAAGSASLSARQFDAYGDRVAAWLAGKGIVKGDRVALYGINGPEFAVAYFGIVKAGAVVVPLNLLQNPRELAYVVKDSGAKGLIHSAVLGDKVAALDEFELGLGFAQSIGSVEEWTRLAEGMSVPEIDIDPGEDLAAILYTSGTTGNPKGAMLTHRNLAFDTWSAAQATQLRSDDVLLVVLPMFHSFAASVGMIMPLLWGAALAPVPKFDASLVADTIAAVGATVFMGVPSMYNVLLHLPDASADKLRSLRLCVSGGAAMPVALMNAFEQRFGLAIHEGDGPTECSPVTCLNPIGGERKPASVGLPIPMVEMAIRDLNGKPVADGEVGEICVRGANVMKGYWHLPEATAESFWDDWFRTGDLGLRDGDGYFFIVDRIKDMIIVNGMNVYPRMVEEVLYEHPAVSEAAVIGAPHESHGEIPVAYVALKAAATSAELRAFCRDRLGPHQVPRRFTVLDALPKNAAGKIVKRELRKQGELERGVDLPA